MQRKECLQTHFKTSITLKTKHRQRYHTKKSIRWYHLGTQRQKCSRKYDQTEFNNYIKNITQHDQVEFIPGMQGWLSIQKLIYMTHHVNKLKNKNHMIILKDTGKAFDKIQHAFRIKNYNKLCTEKIKFNTIRAIYDKPTVTITLNSEQLKAFLLRSRTKKLLLTLLSNILVEVTPIRQVKEIKRIQTG